MTATGLLGIALLALVLKKIEQQSAEPFPGAVVVLESSEWKARARRHPYDIGYEWLAPQSIMYTQSLPQGYQVVRHQINPAEPAKTALHPQPLPLVLKPYQWIRNLSPDGKILCLIDGVPKARKRYLLVPTEGKTKPVVIETWCNELLWSPDSRSLLSTWGGKGVMLKQYDAQTGELTETKLQTQSIREFPILTRITPDGKLLCYQSKIQYQGNQAGFVTTWKVSKIEKDRVVETASGYIQQPVSNYGRLSPTGDRILWDTSFAETSFMQRLEGMFLRQTKKPSRLIQRWEVSDCNGKNRHTIGSNALADNPALAQLIQANWTPDGKGIHFVKDGKLCYLDLSK